MENSGKSRSLYCRRERKHSHEKLENHSRLLTGAALVIGGIAATVWGCVKKFPAPVKGPEIPPVSGNEEAKTEDHTLTESQDGNQGDS